MKKAFFINGGAGRVLCAIPALEHYKKNIDPDVVVVSEGWDELYMTSSVRDNVYNVNHKRLFEDKLRDRELITLEPYRMNAYFNQKCNLIQAFDMLINEDKDNIPETKNLNLEIASEYLLMATWLAYLKSKLLLPGTPEEEFKVQEVAEKLKLQLKKLELIRLLSEQMLKRKRLGREIRTRGMKGNIRSIYSTEYNLSLFELMKAYSTIIMTKAFQKMNIPKLPVFTTEDGIKTIREFFGKLFEWKKLDELIPSNFKSGSKYKITGKAGIFAGSLELVKEGNLSIKQDKLFDEIYIKEIND